VVVSDRGHAVRANPNIENSNFETNVKFKYQIFKTLD
jgi:hypothetical protein